MVITNKLIALNPQSYQLVDYVNFICKCCFGVIFYRTRPWPAFGRQGLLGLSGGYTSHGHTSHASPRACGARLGQIVKSV